MVKKECKEQAEKILSVGQIFEAYLNLSATGDPKIAMDLFPANEYFINSLVDRKVLTDSEGKSLTQKLADMSLLMHEGKPFSDISAIAREGKEKALQTALDKLAECECGPGQELKEVQLKVPILISKTVEHALEKSGYDVGTDEYHADPDRFVSVIVRPTKELELRSGG